MKISHSTARQSFIALFFGANFFLWMLLSSCGAPLKNADSVKGIFQNSKDLNTKVADLCATLNARSSSPNLVNVGLANEMCTKPASQAVNYPTLDRSVSFSLIDSNRLAEPGASTASNEFFHVRTRTELWLMRNLLQIAQVMFNQLKNETDSLLGSGGTGTPKNKDFTFKVIGKPSFDSKTYDFQLDFNLISSREQNGQVDLNNDFHVSGLMLDQKYFAARAETVGERDVKQSLMHSGNIMIFLIPHAGDLYLDVTTDLKFYSFGVDAAMKKQIVDSLGPGLKSIPDLITGLQDRAGK